MAHQGDGGSLNGDIAAASHGNADIGLRQRRRVVDTVADHGYAVTLRLQLFDRFGFALRQHAGNHPVDTGLFGNGVGGHRVVAG
ncbi:hypothetical protein D3C76_1546640 [compost metagenome]